MTRDQLIAEALQRLGDTSAAFATNMATTFDLVLGEMASRGAISLLNTQATFLVTDNTRDFATQTITGLSAPNYPYEVRSIRVPAWGFPRGILEHVTEEVLEAQRLRDGDTQGQPRVWAFVPDEVTIRIHPKAGSPYSGATAEINFLKPPAVISGSTEISEVRNEDLPTFVKGMVVYGMTFMDEAQAEELVIDRQRALQDWNQGLAVMAARARKRMLTNRQVAALSAVAAAGRR